MSIISREVVKAKDRMPFTLKAIAEIEAVIARIKSGDEAIQNFSFVYLEEAKGENGGAAGTSITMAQKHEIPKLVGTLADNIRCGCNDSECEVHQIRNDIQSLCGILAHASIEPLPEKKDMQ